MSDTTTPIVDPITGDRYYQSRCVESIRQAIRRGKRRILVVSPTGSGKMRVIARIMQLTADRGNHAGFAAHARELVEQNEATLESLNTSCHVVMSGRENEHQSAADAAAAWQCLVMAKDTLWARVFGERAKHNRHQFEPPDLDVLLFDEAHLSLAKTWRAVADHYQDSILIGFTATPVRTDGRGLGHLYDEMIVMATYEELQEQQFLVPVRIIAPSVPDLSRVRVNAGDYVLKELEPTMNKPKLVGDTVKTWMLRGEGRQTVVFASGVEHSKQLRDEFRSVGVNAEHVDGKTPLDERQDIMAGARAGRIQVVCNYGVATMGVDVPTWKCLVCCRPTKSLGLWWQMAGRIQRPAGGYTDALILDHSANALTHGFPDEDVDWSLQSDSKVQDREAKKRMEKPPARCPKCGEVTVEGECPACGHKVQRPKRKLSRAEKGELKELERNRRNRSFSKQQKQAYWDKMLGWAVGNNYKIGAASHRYKEYFGVWPHRGLKRTPQDGRQSQMLAKDFYRQYVVPQRERHHEFGS